MPSRDNPLTDFGALWLGVICFWLLDAGDNTSMEPYRAFISDRLPKSQIARGFLT